MAKSMKHQTKAPKDQYIEDFTRTFKKNEYECKYNPASLRYDVKVNGHLVFSSISFEICEKWADEQVNYQEHVEFTPEHQKWLRDMAKGEENGISVGGLAHEMGMLEGEKT